MMTAGKKAFFFLFSFCFYIEKELRVESFGGSNAYYTVVLTVSILSNSISKCQKKIHLPRKHRMRNTKLLQSPIPSIKQPNHIVAVCVHTLNINCIITAKDSSQIKKAFTEYCLRHTWGNIVWMQPTSACDFGGWIRLRRAASK